MRAVPAPQAGCGGEVAEPEAQRDDHRGAGGAAQEAREELEGLSEDERGFVRDAVTKSGALTGLARISKKLSTIEPIAAEWSDTNCRAARPALT